MMSNDSAPFDNGSMASEPGNPVNGTISLSLVTLSVVTNTVQLCFIIIKTRYHPSMIATVTSPPQRAQVAPVKKKKKSKSPIPKRQQGVSAGDTPADSRDGDVGPGTSEKRPSEDESSDDEEDDDQLFSRRDLSSIRAEFGRHKEESVVGWLLCCWDQGGDSVE